MSTVQSIVLSKAGQFSGTAIEFKGKKLSYQEFDKKTQEFSAKLIQKGIGPGDIVVLHMQRSIEMVVAMFAIFKTGAAVAPIVSNFPVKRLENVIESSGAKLVINDEVFAEIDGSDEFEGESFEPAMASEDDPAIILYTSGSTGTPKGVYQSQKTTAYLFSQFPYNLESTGIQIKEFDNVIARLNQGFIVAYHYEYPVALLNGKKLVLLSEEEQGSILDTSELLETNKNSFMAILPSQLSLYLEDERFCRAMSNVSCIGFFAEPVTQALQDSLFSLEGFEGSIITVFGQTECFGIGWQDFRNGKGMVPSPLVDIYSIDEDGNRLERGVRGELVVHTPCLFTKYLLSDKEKATAEFDKKKVEIDGKRFLKTGDIGFLGEDNIIRFSGRNDRMVKYHGQRVELAEIEVVMKNHPGIRNSCCLIVKGRSDNDILVAYYEGEHDQDVDLKTLRNDMLEQIPAFMIPVYFIRLPKLPLNTNGKIDYTALKNMPIKYDEVRDNRELNDGEKLIVKLAANLLPIQPDDFSADSNLMALGMDSLNAVLLINGLAEAGYWLSIEDFITSATIEEMGQKLKTRRKVVKEKKDVSSLVRCTDMQTAWIVDGIQVTANIVAFRGIEEDEIKRKCELMPGIHPALRSSFIEDDGKYYTKVLKSRPMRYDYEDLRSFGDGTDEISAAQRKIIVDRAGYLFLHPDLADLLYVQAFRTHDDKTVLDIKFDHRVVDGVGEKILFNEFLTQGDLNYVDNYVEYLEFTADEAARKEAVDFWKDYLSGTEVACLPKNPASTGKHNYKRYEYSMTGENHIKVKELCRKQNISIPAYVLCQYARAIMDVVGKDDIIVPLGVSGRSTPVDGMDKMLGCIVNKVPVRIKREYSEREFMKSYLQADRYGFLQREVIFKECFGMDEVPSISPYIVCQIFPEQIIKEPFKYFENPTYNLFNRGEFLWEDENGIYLLLHPDVDLWDEEAMNKVLKRTEELLISNLK